MKSRWRHSNEISFRTRAYSGSLVSEDGTACLLTTEFKENVSYEKAFDLLSKLSKDYTDSETSVHIVGFPMLMGWVYSLKPQMYMVFGASVIAIALVLILIFRNLAGMASPLANTFILTIWGLGFIGFTGINFSPLLYVLAFLVAARMIGNSHQIAYRYFEELDSSKGDRTTACYQTMKTMWMPNFAAVAADVAGFGVLFIAKIVLMQHLAIIMSFWMATILLTGFLVPVVCSIFPFKVDTHEWSKETCQQDWIARAMMKLTSFSIAPKTRWIVGGLVIILTIGCVAEMLKIKIGDPTPGSPLFYSNHPYNKDQALINKTFDASSENLTLYFDGEPEGSMTLLYLPPFLILTRHMQQTLPDIYKSSNSLINLIRMVNETFHEGDKLWYDLPRDPRCMKVMIAAVMRNAGRGTLNLYMDEFRKQSQINLVLCRSYLRQHSSHPGCRLRLFQESPTKDRKGAVHTGRGKHRPGARIERGDEAFPRPYRLCRVWSDLPSLRPLLPLGCCGSHAYRSHSSLPTPCHLPLCPCVTSGSPSIPFQWLP